MFKQNHSKKSESGSLFSTWCKQNGTVWAGILMLTIKHWKYKVHKTWLEFQYVSFHWNPSQNLNRPQAWCCIFRAFLVDQGIICIFLLSTPRYCSLGGKCCDSLAIILSNDVWGIYNVQPSTATYNAAIKAESLWEFCFCYCHWWNVEHSGYRLDLPSVAHPLQQPLHSQIIANRPLQHMSVDHSVHRRAGYDHMSYVIWQWQTDYIAD